MASLREAELYAKLSKDHVTQASQSLAKFRHYIECNPDETVMDIGCGTGHVTRNVILPSLHPSYKILIGTDVSKDMVQFAKRSWKDDERLHFIEMDAAEQDIQKIHNTLPIIYFNKIFSFYALQWITDRRQLALNINSLLVKGGQAFLVLVINSGIYSVWDTLAGSNKWKTHLKSVKVPLNEYQYMKNPEQEFNMALENEGLQVILSDVQYHKDAFASNIETDSEKKEKLRSVDPLVSLIPDNLKEAYMDDVLELTKKLVGPRGATDYTSLTVICKKRDKLSINY